jgi:shikimate dehydrogenase
MHPRVDETILSRAALRRFEWVVDLIYNPLRTRLLREAELEGCRVRSGLGMLVRQGAEQFRLWTGKEPPLALMRRVVEDELVGENVTSR